MSLVTYRLERDDVDRLLFLFHGYSAEQHHLAAYVPLIDPDERFTAICPRALHDLPDGDWRRVQKADGYHYLIVNGDVTFEHGECTGVLPGRMLRSYDMAGS